MTRTGGKRILKKAKERAMVEFLSKLDEYPFRIKFKHNDYMVGVGNPTFTVNFKKAIPVSYLLNENPNPPAMLSNVANFYTT